MSSERLTGAAAHESAMRTESSVRDSARERASQADSAGAAAAKTSISGAVGNATLASLMGRGGSGQALPSALRAQLEQALGTSLADVRVHEDGAARAAADGMDAQAFTHGRDIYLGAGATTEDAPLLAHEVMHVEQQRHAAAIDPRIGAPGEAAEAQAREGAAQALSGMPATAGSGGGAVPGVQRQPKNDPRGPAGTKEELSITKRMELTRDVAQAVLYGFLQRVSNVTSPPDLRRSAVVKTALMTLAQKAGSTPLFIDVDKFLASVPNDPAEIARRFAQQLPKIVRADALDAVNNLSTQDTPLTTGQRVGNLVKKTAPGEPGPDANNPPPPARDPGKEADRDFQLNQRMQGGPDPKTTSGSIDVLRAARILSGLGGALKEKPQRQLQPDARSTTSIDAAVASIKADALVPAEVRGTKDAEDFAIADRFARDVASQIDIALQKGRDSISLQLGDNFAAVKDKGALRVAVENIIATIRAAFPDNASKVVNIDVKAGDKPITRGRVR